MEYRATYSPEDNKLRLYAEDRLPTSIYDRLKAAGFRWAPLQKLFFAPAWTPCREDLLIELAGHIQDEDTSLVDRADERAERFAEYSEKRKADADLAHTSASTIADIIPFGQPILVGHHSERRARRDAQRIENSLRRAVKLWDTSQYWQDRARGAIRNAKYKERPEVRHRRIKGIESDRRKQQTELDSHVYPPFTNGADIKHIEHARDKLRPGGKLVAICANGPRQQERIKPMATEWIELPPGSFAAEGTNVSAAIAVISAEQTAPSDGQLF